MSRLLFALASAAALALGLVACGGDDLSAGEVIDRYFENSSEVESGQVDIAASVEIQGEGAGSLSGTISGPFQTRDDGFPALDIQAELQSEGDPAEDLPEQLSAGVVSTGDAAWVRWDGETYEVDSSTFAFVRSIFETAGTGQTETEPQSATDIEGLFRSFGVEPRDWFGEPERGSEDGIATAEGEIDLDAMSRDVARILQQGPSILGGLLGGAPVDAPTEEDIQEIREAVDSATYRVGVDEDSEMPRLLELNVEATNPENEEDSLSVTFSYRLNEVNEDQEVTAPEDARPLSELFEGFDLGSLFGLGGFGDTGDDTSPFGDPGDPQPEADGTAPEGEDVPSPEAAEEYLGCINEAESPEDLARCAELLDE